MNRTIGIVSGKGGVGKTVTTINLGYALHKLGEDVILVDADTTASNLGLQLGIYKYSTKFQDVLNGRVRIEDAIIEHPSGLKIVPSSISVKDIKTNVDAYINVFDSLEGIILVDSPPSLTKHSLSVLDACEELLVVSNPDLPSLTNALKVQQISQKRNKEVLGMLLNRVVNKYYELNADEIQMMFKQPILAKIPEDVEVKKSVFHKTPLLEYNPYSPAAVEFSKVACNLIGVEYKAPKLLFLKRLIRRASGE